ncbi:Glycosyl-phosphatidylinositol-anchored molecule-like protein [Vulpes lagopus]|uniref:glycosyl-phosphatidylinositol-anchored molecule-like protein n=1 Tax=Vulpes lagopus TaxID=494514 RepID=UPI001BC943B2|nr:glycosyl-phosphatidylinositol-anchored molecule-like protein [Vulpes lagopus]XP_041624371.1 glycosyl-phosphatidylinositol-anchored molecule-like protein [Vulpes lagopus]
MRAKHARPWATAGGSPEHRVETSSQTPQQTCRISYSQSSRAGLNVRELLVYKNCTYNCTFLYRSQEPPEAIRMMKTNSFYFVRCCNSMTCNEGGPTNLERDIIPDYPIEEELEGAVRLGESTFLLSVASILVSNTLT